MNINSNNGRLEMIKLYKYPLLVAKIAENGIKKKDIAIELNISARALDNKLKGKAPWTWEQVKTLQNRFFPDIPKDQLLMTKQQANYTDTPPASGE